MMYSDKYKYMFYHIPKTAGTSITLLLYNYCENNHIKGEKLITRGVSHVAVSNTWEKYNGKDYFSFAFVRNPYTRLFSLYNFLYRHEIINEDMKTFFRNLDREPTQFRLLEYNNNIPLSFIGKFENIENDFNYITKKIDIPVTYQNLNTEMKAPKQNYKDYFDEEIYNIINTKHDIDFKTFNYKKETI